MDFNILDDATLWVGLSFVLFVLLVIKPLTSMFSQNIDAQIAFLKKEINEAKKLKIEAENLLDEHKAKEKKNTMYIDELKKQTKKEAMGTAPPSSDITWVPTGSLRMISLPLAPERSRPDPGIPASALKCC